ncbi:MAG: hypothetical protein HBSAPP03_24390 [Phycisphaerae bacterium]|nr:MAG: hypothetical protein HBSAPP03_24390 [Phycisphaerae bacterium]
MPARSKRRVRTKARPRQAPALPPPNVVLIDARKIAATRELFWHNVVREFLMSLSVMWAQRSEHDEGTAEGEAAAEDVFDGRIAIITTQGARIAVGAVYPLFACSLSDTADDRTLSTEVECTVFQIETPEGQAFTLPLHEIRAFHSLSAGLMEQIKSAAQESQAEGQNGEDMPFGFAAFTSLAKARRGGQPEFAQETIIGPGL